MSRALAIAWLLVFGAADWVGSATAEPFSFVYSIANPAPEHGGDMGPHVAVSPDGKTIAISSERDDEVGLDAGAFLLFSRDGEFLRKVAHPDSLEGGNLANSMDWTADGRLVVGGWSPGVEAPVYVFNQHGDLIERIVNPTPDGLGQFGVSVAAIGNDILIGSIFDDDLEEDAGAVYLFDEN